MDILNLLYTPEYDQSVTKIRKLKLSPENRTKMSYSDDINIKYYDNNAVINPSESSLYIKGKITFDKVDAAVNINSNVALVSNYPLHLFREISYAINGKTIDTSRNPGVTSTMKNIVSFNSAKAQINENAGMSSTAVNVANNKVVEVSIPLHNCLGFFEDYKKVLLNCRHDLTLIRHTDDANAFVCGNNIKDLKFEIQELQWILPQYTLSAKEKLNMLKLIEKETNLIIPFRSWILREEAVPQGQNYDLMSLMTTSDKSKPRYAIIGFQVGKRNQFGKDNSVFDHVNMRNIKLIINSEQYPSNDMIIKFSDNLIASLYDDYCSFQSSYYGIDPQPLMTLAEFKQNPIVVINSNRQIDDETNITGTADCKLYYESYQNFDADTTLYVLLLCDTVFQYNAYNQTVQKLT